MKTVKHIDIKKNITVDELIKEMETSGVMGAGAVAKAVDIFEKAIKDKECKIFFGMAGAMVPGGMKNIIMDIVKNKLIHVFVTTGANLTHDLVEGLGHHHYQGKANVDDDKLNKEGLYRMYDSYMKNNVYEDLEDFFEKNFDELKNCKSITEFLKVLGKLSPENTILNSCYKNNLPIFCPSLADSGIGLIIWGRIAQGKETKVNAFEDLKDIIDLAWTSKKNAVIYLGGGVPKNYIQQAMQVSPKKASYGIQVTMDRPEPGGSSGAPLKEGISWRKMEKDANFVDVICDVTIALPLIYAALKSRL
ncbi:deoxyhypusine synthase family protein [Candidatus Woesearchaeota archaeon]|nr:deoxyhypusine synthase family protein [Candidatus Woesearchaeota archaeon]